WATSDESMNTVTTVSVKEDTTVYAVWSKGIFWNFGKNGNAAMKVGTGYVQGDNYDQFTTTVGDHRATLSLTNHNIDPERYRVAVVRLAVDQPVPTQIYYKSVYLETQEDGTTKEVQIGYDTNGFAYAEAQSLRYDTSFTGLDDFRTVTFDFYNNDKSNTPGAWKDGKAERIITIYVDPAKKIGATVRLQYIALLDTQRDITFDANTTDTVTGMPENTTAAQGDVLNIAETPVREGYKFVGWSKSPTERKTVKTSFTIIDDTTFYAVWDQTVSGEPVVEDGKAIYAISEISDTAEALLVKAGSAAGNSVSFTYTDAEGNAQRISAVTNGAGYAVIDITAVEGTITDTAVVLSADIASPEITLTDLATATAIANTVPAGGNSNISTGSGSSGSGGNYNYDNTVKDVVNDGEQYTVGAAGGSGDTKSVLAESKSEEDILFNFDEAYEKDFFNSYRQITLNAMADSVLSLTSKGLASGSNDSPAAFTSTITLDADSHRYIVVKAKQSGLSSPGLRVYFQKEGLGFSQANSIAKPMTEQYSMLVYDMKEFTDWTGTVNRLFFSLDGNVLGTFDIDWILFTDTVPESMDDIAGAREIFPVVNEGAIPFTDVTSGDWFYNEVAQAYKLGFVEGTSATAYEPNGSVTIAEAITLAVRLNYIFNQKTLPKAADGAEWYKPFVDAAVRAGIIKNTQFAEYDVPALRKEVASIMAKALPSDFYAKINMFTAVPDMAKTDANYSAVLKLYNAGILNGSDEAYNFYPDTNITRAEIAAIVNRIAVATNRKRIVTEAEIESRKVRYYADDIAASATLGNCTAGKLTLKNGLAYGTGKANESGRADPIVYLSNLLGNLNGKEISKITIGMKWNTSETNAAAQIYFTTPTGGWAAERMLASTKGETHEDGVVDFVFDTSKNGQFANTITGLRFDPFDAPYEFAIAYVIIE
ncbi:MAG: S-layer homology domain-containing protein, partial [Eubacteriales bacterium]